MVWYLGQMYLLWYLYISMSWKIKINNKDIILLRQNNIRIWYIDLVKDNTGCNLKGYLFCTICLYNLSLWTFGEFYFCTQVPLPIGDASLASLLFP